VVNRTTGVAADSRRVWFLNNGQWTPSLGGPDAGDVFGSHAFASPWWAPTTSSITRGATENCGCPRQWRRVATDAHELRHPSHPSQGMRQSRAFCTCGPRTRRRSTHLDVYYGDGVDLWRQAVTTVVPGGNVGDWRKLNPDHSDPADLAFTPGNTEPLMLATDGGVASDEGTRANSGR